MVPEAFPADGSESTLASVACKWPPTEAVGDTDSAAADSEAVASSIPSTSAGSDERNCGSATIKLNYDTSKQRQDRPQIYIRYI